MEVKANGGCSPRQLTTAFERYLQQSNANTSTKRKRVLASLLCAHRHNWVLTRFDAEHIGDHCFNTTVSEIGRIDGVEVSRRETKRPTRFGKPTDCKEYWLDAEAAQKASLLLGVKQ